jgi:hypothetical protein
MAEHDGGGHEGGGHEGGFWEKYVLPVAHAGAAAWEVGGHAAQHAFEHVGLSAGEAGAIAGTTGTVAKALPYLGMGIGLGQAGYHGYEMMQHTDQSDGSYSNNEFYTEMGEATLGGAGAVASFCPPAALYLAGGELALNGLGAASGAIFGDDYSFSAGSVVGGIEHGVHDAAVGIGQGASAAWDAASDW